MLADLSFSRHPWIAQTQAGLESIAAALGFSGARIDYQIGAVIKVIQILGNTNYCYFKYPRTDNGGGSLWDYAASSCLVNEAGLVACDMQGQHPELNRAGNTDMDHRGVVFTASSQLAEQIMALNARLSSS